MPLNRFRGIRHDIITMDRLVKIVRRVRIYRIKKKAFKPKYYKIILSGSWNIRRIQDIVPEGR